MKPVSLLFCLGIMKSLFACREKQSPSPGAIGAMGLKTGVLTSYGPREMQLGSVSFPINGENKYLTVTGNAKNFGDGRLDYNKAFQRRSQLSNFFNCACNSRGLPDIQNVEILIRAISSYAGTPVVVSHDLFLLEKVQVLQSIALKPYQLTL